MRQRAISKLIELPPLERFCRNRRGNIAVEFALILPVALLMLAGVIEFGLVTYDKSSIESAARAGAQFAYSGGYDASKVAATVRSASAVSLGPNDSVASKIFCECTDSTPIACGGTCSNLGPNRRFIKVSVTKTHQTWLPFLGSLVPNKVAASATIRMQ